MMRLHSTSQPGTVGSMRQYRIADLHAHLRQIRLSRGLAFLGYLSTDLWLHHGPFRYLRGEVCAEWQLAFLARELIRVGSDLSPLNLDDVEHAVRALHLANGLVDHFQLNDSGPPQERRDNRHSFLIRLANDQFAAQTQRWYYIPRYVSLFEQLPRVVRETGEPDLEEEFRAGYGMTIRDFIWLGFSFLTYVSVKERPVLRPEALIGADIPPLKEVLTAERVDAALRAIATDVEALRVELGQASTAPAGLERHAFNPLWRRPIVRTSLGYVVPSLWLLLQRFTAGIYFDFLDRRLGDRAAIQRFTSLVGRAFEAHVGAELACHFGSGELLPEPTYLGGAWKGPDWTLVEGRAATLVECKTSRLTRAERELADIPTIKRRLRQDIIPAIRLLPQKTEHIRNRASGLEHWPDIDDVECVIVTLEPWWPEALMKSLIAEELAGDPAAGVQYHLMAVEQMEHLGSFRPKTRIFDLLRRRWQADPRWDTRKYLFEEAKRLGVTPTSPRMDATANAFFAKLEGFGGLGPDGTERQAKSVG